MHNIIPSKEQRYIWKISADPLCPVCKEPETYIHHFIKCKEVQPFWAKVENSFRKLGINKTYIKISEKSVPPALLVNFKMTVMSLIRL